MVSPWTDDELIASWIADDDNDWSPEKHRAQIAAVLRHERSARGTFRLGTSGKSAPGRIYRLRIHNIQISASRRPLNEARVLDLMQSIEKIGLLHLPVAVMRDGVNLNGEEVDCVAILVAGRHRLEAWRRLGNLHIDTIVITADDIEAELIEISENLHRAELTALERDEQVARWIELTVAKPAAEEVPRQADAKPKGGRPEGGTRAAARELGLSEADARRATKVASLSEEAKATAREVGLDDNRTALLAAAKATEPERQVAALTGWGAEKTAGADPNKALREAVVAAASGRMPRPSNRNPLYKPDERFKAIAAVAGNCDTISAQIETHGGEFIVGGAIDDGMKERTRKSIVRCIENLNELLSSY